ncbi:MAG: AraC family transcriptional regulator [Bacteroidales bacterium]|jgi:AraC-like DNA-binding protein|nr:AraC family transcriptional regulator [Bacteroidales bacterium]
MGKETILQEITQVDKDDLFVILNYTDAKFDYAVHFHSEYELSLVTNTKGTRIVGDCIENFGECDLVLVGPNIPHAWNGEEIKGSRVVTIQFDEHLMDYVIIGKRVFKPVRDMLARAKRGISFTIDKRSPLCKKIIAMYSMSDINATLNFISLLYDLATYPKQRLLTGSSFDSESVVRESKSRRIARICSYINKHYNERISLPELAKEVAMSDSTLSHFFKKHTRRNLVDYITDIRIGHATKMLLDTTYSIGEISCACGFNNISYFNRIFKRARGITPSEYRESIQQVLAKF